VIPSSGTPSDSYLQRKARFGRCLTVYGRKTVLEALQAEGVSCERLHLARSNRPAPILEEIEALARAQGAEILLHGREELARISRHSREDQGVAADLRTPGHRQLADVMPLPPIPGTTLLAVDGVSNPQNLGMLIRSAVAAGIEGILVPRRGGCDLGPLVIKASAGTLFRAPLLRCETLAAALTELRRAGWRISVLDGRARASLFEGLDTAARVFVLGGESSGVSDAIRALADESLRIPMANGVESLNVAVAAALVAFRSRLASGG
jgi:23S rRNA (guanosine2251-2'-O)-methyltransferase